MSVDDQSGIAGSPADWYPDPTGRHQTRYWDGGSWTDHVGDAGEQGLDPLASGADLIPATRPADAEGSDVTEPAKALPGKSGSQLVNGMAVLMLVWGAYALIHVVQWMNRGYLLEVVRYVLLSVGWLGCAFGLYRRRDWARWLGAATAAFDVAARLVSVGSPGISDSWISAVVYCVFPALIGWFLLRPEFKARLASAALDGRVTSPQVRS